MRASLRTALVLLLALPVAVESQAREPLGRSSATLTSAIRVGNMVYASGQLGLSRNPADSAIEGQTRLALEATKAVFEQAGTTMENAVRCTVFLTDVADFQRMNAVYSTFWPVAPPARSTVVVKALVVPAARIEIECMAVMPVAK